MNKLIFPSVYAIIIMNILDMYTVEVFMRYIYGRILAVILCLALTIGCIPAVSEESINEPSPEIIETEIPIETEPAPAEAENNVEDAAPAEPPIQEDTEAVEASSDDDDAEIPAAESDPAAAESEPAARPRRNTSNRIPPRRNPESMHNRA